MYWTKLLAELSEELKENNIAMHGNGKGSKTI